MSAPAIRPVYRFGDFELDAAAYQLMRNGQRLHLARQPMELLLLLVEKSPDLVSRDEIARRLWREDVFVDVDAGIQTAVLKIRQALGDPGRKPPFVETVAGKGYRFAAPVEFLHRTIPEPTLESPNAPRSWSPARHHNLPADLTSFVGRRQELAELPQRLAASRLLTLTGSGGAGKTRLAIRLASDVIDRFADGVWMADLSALSEPHLIDETIASVLGLRESPHRSARHALLDYLRDRQVLLVVDTCEHVVAACAELISTLLREAPQLRVVATSREALAVPGEAVYRVPSLAVPAESTPLPDLIDADAVRLFVERATAIDSTFKLTAANAAAIVRICGRLDGIPLAIELAAARVSVLSPEQVEKRLDDRFRLLTGGSRTIVARQRTLEAAVQWSYQLLSQHERQLLDRLSVFPMSWTLEAAEHVCDGDLINRGEVLNLLSRLVDKSLVVCDRVETGEHRYRLLDTLREYAAARLAEDGATDSVRSRHFQYFFSRFRDSQCVLRGAGQLSRLEQLRVDIENVRAALEWGLSSKSHEELAVELATAMFWYWTKCGLLEEGKRWLRRAATIEVPPATRARALYGLAHMHHFQGDQPLVSSCGSEVELLGETIGDTWAVSVGRFLQALAAFEMGDFHKARAGAIAARDAADACGEIVEHGGPLMILANLALVGGDEQEAIRLYEESIAVHRRAGDVWGLSILLSINAGLSLVRDDVDAARVRGAEALALCRALKDPRGVAWSLEVFAGLVASAGCAGDAARLWGASDALLETSGGTLTATIGWIRDRYIEPARQALGDSSFMAARAEGQRLSVDDAVRLVGAHTQRG